MVTSLMQKHGLKSAAKRERLLAAAEEEAEENLDAQVRLQGSSSALEFILYILSWFNCSQA